MSIYTTPLQLGYFFSLLMFLILWIRGHREQRLSDQLLGWVMFILAMELQDYTFGFAGINILWNELNGFPRSVHFLFGPTVYFYFRSQVNRSFKIGRHEWLHFAPYLIYFSINLMVFIQGSSAVIRFQSSLFNTILTYIYNFGILISYIYYLSLCVKIYRQYKEWYIEHFSSDQINFSWFRNFVYAMIFWLGFREIMHAIDYFYTLDFYQEWWWNLALVAVTFYIGLIGFAQIQPAIIEFEERQKTTLPSAKNVSKEENIIPKLESMMKEERLFLQAELNLHELAQHLQTKPSELSSAINQVYKMNFNEYINRLRVKTFIEKYKADSQRRFTMLSLALDSGFNSKATFNRAFKKIMGESPKTYFDRNEA